VARSWPVRIARSGVLPAGVTTNRELVCLVHPNQPALLGNGAGMRRPWTAFGNCQLGLGWTKDNSSGSILPGKVADSGLLPGCIR